MLDTEFIPAAQKDSRRLLVALHGLGDSKAGMRWLPEALDLPWLNFLLVNAPDEYYGGFSWYDIYGDSAPGVRRSRNCFSNCWTRSAPPGFRRSRRRCSAFPRVA